MNVPVVNLALALLIVGPIALYALGTVFPGPFIAASNLFLYVLYRLRGRYLSWTVVSRELDKGIGALIANVDGVWPYWWQPDRAVAENAKWRHEFFVGAYATSVPRTYGALDDLEKGFPKALVVEVELDDKMII